MLRCVCFLGMLVVSLPLLAGAGGQPSPAPQSSPEIAPARFTLRGKAVSLSSALRQLKRQTGIDVLDKRRVKNDPSLDLDLSGVTFWQAADAIAREAGAVLSLYQGEGQIALVDGPPRPLRVSYSGLFRTVAKRVSLTHDFDSGARYVVLQLEVAWEPRLEPFYLDQGPASVTFDEGQGKAETVRLAGKGQTPVQGRTFQEFSLRFPAPGPAAAKLGTVKGELALLTPSKMLTFTFDKLARSEQKKEGITVRLTRVSVGADEDPWEVEVALDYPPDGPHFESYQSWLVNNEVFLEKIKGGTRVRPPQGGMQTVKGAYPRALLRYYFENGKRRLGDPRDWKLVYRTPGRIVNLPVQFEFKDLPLR
jgi:hypothetical protein